MRILIATWHQAIVGGTEAYLRDILPALRERGHELAMLVESRASPSQACVDATGELPIWHLTRAVCDRTLAEVEQWSPDVCYLQGLEEPDFQHALARRFPTILFAHDYHGTCISGNKRFSFPGERPCTKTFGPACLLHYLPRGCGGRNPLTMIRLYRTQRRRLALLNECRAILVASRAMMEEYGRHGVPHDRLRQVPLFPTAPGPTTFPVRPRFGRILFLGRLTDVKGCHLAMEAVATAGQRLGTPLEFVVAGDGPERERLEHLAQRSGVQARFLGWVKSQQRTELLDEADLIVVPSVWPEPFGLVGLEAAVRGVPAVGFAVGGIPDWLVPGDTGEFAPGDPPTAAGLADALVRALHDPAHYQKLCHGAWKSAQRFRLTDHVVRLEAIFEAAANDRTAPHGSRLPCLDKNSP